MPKAKRDWFANFAPVITKPGATGATGATPTPKASKITNSAATALLHPPDSTGATGAAHGSDEVVAPVAPPFLRRCNTGPVEKSEENQAYPSNVAPVAPVAPENGARASSNEEHDERAAIVADGSGCTGEWAQAFARLDPAQPPPGMSPWRWGRFVDTCGRFIDTWAHKAAELGWRPIDVFGDDLDKQVAEIGRHGLLWRMEDGGRVIALTEQTAVIETMIGARITYRRQPADESSVVAWQVE